MENMFQNTSVEKIKENITVQGAAGFYKPGIHKIVDTEIFIFDTEFNGNTYTNAVIEFIREDGAKLQQELKTKTKSNQSEGETDLSNFMGKIAMGTGREAEYDGLGATFMELPLTPYTTMYKKEVQAKVIRIFSNAKYSIVTTTSIRASNESLYTSQILDERFVFRAEDNASSGEIKDGDEEKFGKSFEYWSDEDNVKDKISIAYVKSNYDNWDGDYSDRTVKDCVTQAVEYFKDGGNLSEPLPNQDGVDKADLERVGTLFIDGLSAADVKQRMSDLKGVETATTSIDDEEHSDSDEPDFS